ncbi:histidine--tRNA ligase [Bacillus sp. UMB0728]|uniref:histidine--tRNA ligase n=1 Tax=Bacillus sp. UMB0728 TaxID=2066052 RepID=UPI000C76AEA1|nr:histidine--tRNA ligase [Bacillus sp. UMB0728]PLR74881.1 histidine--tRNA ligase [Bacillus sp. UMB0728]
MKKMDYQNVKGTKDYLPEEEILRRRIQRELEDVFIQYGCKPLETPILNYTELLASKYGGGAEILEEMYTLSDRGGRDLALRYDLTIPFAKAAAMNPGLRLPFKRYEIGRVFRDGPIKTGRLREFTQCDVDIAGADSQLAEAELMVMALDAFSRIGLDVTIQYNNRKLLSGMLQEFGVPEEKSNEAILVLDKLEKAGWKKVSEELAAKGIGDEAIQRTASFISDTNIGKLAYYKELEDKNVLLKEGLQELKELEGYLTYLDCCRKANFNPFLARGLDIYTGTIYEIFLTDRTLASSIGSGGRYDNAIGGFIGSGKKVATVGISFGLDVIFTAVSQSLSRKEPESTADYYLIPINTPKESLALAQYLRGKGWRVEMELGGRKVSKALEKANKDNIREVILLGAEEVSNNQYKIRDMKTGEEKIVKFDFSKTG